MIDKKDIERALIELSETQNKIVLEIADSLHLTNMSRLNMFDMFSGLGIDEAWGSAPQESPPKFYWVNNYFVYIALEKLGLPVFKLLNRNACFDNKYYNKEDLVKEIGKILNKS